MWGNDTLFEEMVQDFEAIERDSNKNVDEQEVKEESKTNEQEVKESYGNVYIEADIKLGLSKERIIKKIQDRYPDIGDEQAAEIYDGVVSGEGGGWEREGELESKTNEDAPNWPEEEKSDEEKEEDLHAEAEERGDREIERRAAEFDRVEGGGEQLIPREDDLLFIDKTTFGEGWDLLRTREGGNTATVMFKFVSEEAASAAGSKIADAIGGEFRGKEDPRKPEGRQRTEAKEVKESKMKKSFNLRDMWELKERDVLGSISEQEEEAITDETGYIIVKDLSEELASKLEDALRDAGLFLYVDPASTSGFVLSTKELDDKEIDAVAVSNESREVKEEYESDLDKDTVRGLKDAWALIGAHDSDASVRSMADRKIGELAKRESTGEVEEEKVNEQIGGEMIGPIDIEPEDFDIVADTLDPLGEIDPELAEAEGQSSVTIVITDGKRFIGIDPQGYDYARYKTDVYDSAQAVMDAAGLEGEWERKRTAGA